MNNVAIIGTGETKFSKNEQDVQELLIESTLSLIHI